MSKCINCRHKLEKKKKAKIVAGYTCDVCGKIHINYQKAEDCEKSHKQSEEVKKTTKKYRKYANAVRDRKRYEITTFEKGYFRNVEIKPRPRGFLG